MVTIDGYTALSTYDPARLVPSRRCGLSECGSSWRPTTTESGGGRVGSVVVSIAIVVADESDGAERPLPPEHAVTASTATTTTPTLRVRIAIRLEVGDRLGRQDADESQRADHERHDAASDRGSEGEDHIDSGK